MTGKMVDATKKKPRYFYGWNVVAASFMAHLAYAEHHSSMLGFFFRPFQNEFGWNRSALAAVQTIARVAEAMVAPIVGPFIDRYGSRLLMPVGAVIVSLAMLAVTQIDAIWQFYLLRGIVVALGFTLMGNLVTDVAINNWFVKKRGRAVAIARLGSNISNMAFVPLTVFIIGAHGWRTMFVVFAVITWLVVLIPSLLLMRRRPEDMGLYPDGIDPNQARAGDHSEDNTTSNYTPLREPIWSRREVLATRTFWILAVSFGACSMAFQGINISLAPYIQDLGYADTMVASVMTVRAAIMATSLPFMGLLIEHSQKILVRITPFAIQGVAAILFLVAEQPAFLWMAVAVYGIGMSGVGVMQGTIWADYFGRFSLGLVRSIAFFMAFGFGAIGPLAMNVVFDVMGSYKPAFMVIAGLFAIAAFLMTTVRPPKARRYTTADEMMFPTG
ncbi:MAG: MFS transporter [Dehalococcoidales bacterium]|nr:MAG: MFS transporter [Dehalococcoidales bacterium]